MLFRTNIRSNNDGATLVEFTLIAPLLLLITFSFVEFGFLFYQFSNAQKATQLGAREASTRFMISGIEDCWVSTAELAGTDCASIDNSGVSPIVCTGDNPGGCNATGVAAVVTEMQRVFPTLQPSNIEVTFSPTNLGFVGRGKPIPAVTVTVNDLTYDYIVIGVLYNVLAGDNALAGTIGITSAETTLIGEDIGDGA